MKRIKNKIFRILTFAKDRILFWGMSYDEEADGTGIRDCLKKMVLQVMSRGRKLVVFYGECHINVYVELLRRNKEFERRYIIVGGKDIEYLAKYHKSSISTKNTWNKADVLIYNPGVPQRVGAPSLGDVLEWINGSAIRVGVTNAVFKGYMPQHTEKIFENEGHFIWGDKNLNALLEGTGEIYSDAIQLLDEAYYSPEFVNEFFDKNVKRMKQYERQCLVKIADYIERYGKQRVLYHSVTHPGIEVMEEIGMRILNVLECDVLKWENGRNSIETFDLRSHAEIVYPSVYSGLGISEKWEERRVRPGNFGESYSIQEYVQEYLRMGIGGLT